MKQSGTEDAENGTYGLMNQLVLTLEQIPLLAKKFASLDHDPEATRCLELFGCAFVWSDEKPVFDNVDGVVAISRFFQYLLWYRKSLIEQKPFEAFTQFWSAFQEECPTWPGFRPERCSPQLLIKLQRETDETLCKLNRVVDICDRKHRRKIERQSDSN